MDRRGFVDAIAGKEFRLTRTCLATGRVEKEGEVIPTNPIHHKTSSSISIRMIHCYNDDDLFTHDYGVFVAVIKAGAGHLHCERFAPVSAGADTTETG